MENVGAGNSGFAVDNFSFTVIPEPGSIVIWSLLGIIFSSLVGARLRRK